MTGKDIPHPFFRGTPHLIAHRGGAALGPENTLAAIEQAARLYQPDIIEIDVRATADGHCVLMHDPTLDRTTSGSGAVARRTLAELKQLDAGHRFVALDGTHPFRGQGVTIPTIDEVFNALPDMRFIVEIKIGTAQQPLLDAIRRFDAFERVLVAGERDIDRTLFPDYPGPMSESGDAMRRMFRMHKLRLMRFWRPTTNAVQFPFEYDGRRVVNERLVRELKQKGIVVHVWTVNDPDDMRMLLDWRVDGILSDRPDLLADVMKR
ncbi:MAG TPA: glycerophosphodiester phosphodiesterase [Longimicrobiales bacterium]